MLSLLALCLLIGPACTAVGDTEEAESWVTMTSKGTPVPSIRLQLPEVKRSRTRQFYGLMGKRVEGIHPIQPRERMGYQLGRIVQDLLGTSGLSIEGTCGQEAHHQAAGPGAVAREGLQTQRGTPDFSHHQQLVGLSLGPEEDGQGSK